MKFSITDGWLDEVRGIPSPNCDTRPGGQIINLLVIHGICLPPGEFGGPWIDAFFTGTLDVDAHPYFSTIIDLKVSSHLLIRRTGEIVQYVPLHMRSWHAGESYFDGISNCNDYSIGIELEGAEDTIYEEIQYQILTAVTRAIMAQYPDITRERITGHCDIAPGRKTDPYATFDWAHYNALLQEP